MSSSFLGFSFADFALWRGRIRFPCFEFSSGKAIYATTKPNLRDAAASLFGSQIYAKFFWRYEKQMVDGVHALGARVRLHIRGNTRKTLDQIATLGCDIIDLDSVTPMVEGIIIIPPFLPSKLIEILRSEGFASKVERGSGADWLVYFWLETVG